MTKREFVSYFFYFILTFLILSTHWYWNFSLRSYVEPAVDPVYDLYRTTSNYFRSSVQYFRSRSELTAQLKDLRRRNRRLKKEVYRGKAALRENTQLRNYLGLPPRPDGKIIPVEILQKNLTGWERTVRVNRGSDDGLRKDQLAVQVINDTWVVRGRVFSTSSDNSLLIMSSDPRFKIGAEIRGVPGRQFVARGSGYRGLRIKNFPSFINLDVGNRVFTSSGSTLTPQQLFLGEVSVITNPDGKINIGRTVEISPPRFRTRAMLWVIVNDE